MSSEADAVDGIAIIGLAGRFPGAANVAKFWENLVAGRETISTLSDAQLLAAGFDPATLRANPAFVPARGILERPEWFDAAFFGISPREAEVMDPQQRVFLEEAWTALEDAGIDPTRSPGAIGVFAGMSNNTYFAHNVAGNPELLDAVGPLTAMMANEKDYLATRTAYKLDLRGPALNIYTACSTSLVAVCQAVSALQTYQCDVALAGGISITFPQERGYETQEGGITSPDGHCRAFDRAAAGTVFSSGVGVVVLKRLADALSDGDRVVAVIKGAALNNDGASKVSFTAPSVDGHAEVIALAHALAGFAPETISYVEAHGTATPLGDPIEIGGLTQAFGSSRGKTCALGSVKTNIGHLDAAAGIAGLIKTALALQHRQLPASLHFQEANPQLQLESSPFYVNTQLRAWPQQATLRRAGVSSFGVGGTNAHVVLEEAPDVSPTASSARTQVLVLSAKTATALENATRQLASHLPEALADAAFTLQMGRQAFNHRRCVLAKTRAEAVEALQTLDAKRVFSRVQERRDPPVAFMFPGQGAQQAGMGAELYATEPVFREAIDRCAELLRPFLEEDLREIMFAADAAKLTETRYTQPALFVISYATAQLWLSRGVQPDAFLGHSVGEYVAATLAGVFSLEDALHLVARRAALVQALPAGAMLAVRLPEPELAPLLDAQLSLAAINSPKLCVVSGPQGAVDALESALTARGVAARKLATSHAFHSAMLEPAVAPFTALVEKITLRKPTQRFLSNLTGDWITDAQATDPAYWASHLRKTVRFADGLGHLLENGPRVLLECGPGQTLCQLTRQHGLCTSEHDAISSADDAAAKARLWLAGVSLDWAATHAGETRRRVALPTYPFDRQRYWAEPRLKAAATPLPATDHARSERVEAATEPAPSSTTEEPASLLAEILEELQRLSGTSLAGIDPRTNFIELGFDSLFLTQASLALQKRFRVPITFRRLLEDVPSPQELADWLRDKVPTRSPKSAPAAAAPVQRTSEELSSTKAHGPFRRIDTAQAAELIPAQRAHLQDLETRYVTRTAGSKNLTAKNRGHLADPRAVAGFRRTWKEMVYPLVVDRSSGARLWDIDGNEYVDVTLGFGQNLLGHRPDFVVQAVENQLHRGIEIGPTSPLAGEVAALMCEFSGHERAAFCNTGSEAVTAALRVARTVTGRSRIAMFAGAYHGIFDEVLVRPGSNHSAQPIAPGIEPGAMEHVLLLEYGTDEALALLRAHAHELAAVLVEPVQSRRPELQPRAFLQELRAITAESGSALIFDEVVTGFRFHPGGAQAWFDVRADLATYGKVVGGGLPIGIVTGAARFLDALDGGAWNYGDDSFPEVGVTFFAGTFVRHPLALAAAKAVLEHLRAQGPALQETLNARTADLVMQLNAHLARRGVPLRWTHCASMYFLAIPPELKHASLLWYHLRLRGIHAWESRPSFLSTVHTAEDVARIVTAFCESVDELIAAGFLPQITPDFPLTDAQREVFFACQLGADAACSFNESITLQLRGPLEIPRLQNALTALQLRHEALRLGFSEDGETQRVLPLRDFALQSTSISREALPGATEAASLAEFDLAAGPLFRPTLFQLGPDNHALVLTVHHLVCDGWSFGVLANELGALYRGAALPPARPFRDYPEWLQTQQSVGTEAFWLQQFAEPPKPLELPTDRPRGITRSYRGDRCATTLAPELMQALQSFSAKRRGTVFSTMLAAFHLLLHRLSGQDDVTVGIAAAGQAAMGCDSLVGHCLNFLPIRARFSGDESFSSFLERIKTTVLDAFEHQNFTFGTLLQKLALPRDASRMPLLGATFNIDRSATNLDFGEIDAAFEINPKKHLGLEISFNLIETASGTQLYCAFNCDLFEKTTIERWLRHYLTLLEEIVRTPELPLARLPLLTAAETRHVLETWNATKFALPPEKRVHELFEKQAAATPGAIAVQFAEEQLTYRELNQRANQLAHWLQTRGARPGVAIGICLERSPALIVALLGVLKSGAAYVPLDPAYPQARLTTMLRKSGAQLLVTQEKFATDFSADTVCMDRDWPQIAAGNADNLSAAGEGTDLAYIIYTSGSTGEPKGIEIEHGAVVNLLASMRQTPGLTAADTLVAITTISFDIAVVEIFLTLSVGARLHLLSREDAADPGRLAPHLESATVLQATPATWRLLVQSGWTGNPRLKIFCGGEALSPELARELLARCDQLWNLYGPTETTVYSVGQRIVSAGSPIAIGRPLANTEALILNEALQVQPAGVVGQLFLGGAGLARGYRGQPKLTSEKFIPHPFDRTPGARLFATGDLAVWQADGTIRCLGRIDHQVKLRGFRIELGEIETVLLAHPQVREAVVVARGEADPRLVAYLVPTNGALEIDAVRTELRAKLPDYMVPSAFVRLEQLPLTANGKIDRRALPEPEPQAGLSKGAFVPPRNEAEAQVAEVWRAVLQLSAVSVHDDFFDLGGHSLAAMQVVTRLRGTLHPDLRFHHLFEFPTIAGLVETMHANDCSGEELREEGVL